MENAKLLDLAAEIDRGACAYYALVELLSLSLAADMPADEMVMGVLHINDTLNRKLATDIKKIYDHS